MSDFPYAETKITPSRPESLPAVPQQLVELHGWGRAAGTRAHLTAIDSVADAVSALRQAGGRGVVPRGLGRSYGDAAQNAGGTALDLTRLDRILQVNGEGDPPTVTVQAGVSLDALMRALLPFGLWVPVLPGTRQVTVGGAIAADVHGKNHHTEGSFGDHVRSLDLLTADGSIRTLSPDDPDPALFWATVGGMGLTGVVTSATVAVQRTESAYFLVDTERCTDLDDLMTKMQSARPGLHLLRGLVRRRHQGPAPGARGADPRQQGPAAGPHPEAPPRPTGFSVRPRWVPFPRSFRTGWSIASPRRPSVRAGTGRRRSSASTSCRTSPSSSIRWTSWRNGTASTDRTASCSTSSWCRSAKPKPSGPVSS